MSEETALVPAETRDIIDAETGEVTTPPPMPVLADPYVGIAAQPFDVKIEVVLHSKIPEDEIEIRAHDGIIYWPGMFYRLRLDTAFGCGGWALRRKNLYREGNLVCFDGALYAHGRFIGESIGGAEFIPTNKQMNYTDVCESAKTECLTRCCKDIGIARELWMPQFIESWKQKYAATYQDQRTGKTKWKKKAPPQYNIRDLAKAPTPDDAPPPIKDGEPERKKVTTKQVQSLQILIKELGINDRDERLARAGKVVGRKLESFGDLYQDEADLIRKAVAKAKAANDG